MKKLLVLLVAISMVLFVFGTANAALLAGNQIYATYEQPFSTLIQNYGLLTVGAGVEIPTDGFGGYFTVDLSDTNIKVTFLQGGNMTPDTGTDGLHFQDTLNNITGFAVSINPLTDMAGFDASRIALSDSNNIFVNWNTLAFSAGTVVSLDLAPVPIPGAVWLLGSGLLGLVGIGRKRLRK